MTKNILVAPLNWGLGHATRCIPLIRALKEHGFTPLIACDGMAKTLLEQEFPDDVHLELPSYNIRYPKKGLLFRYQLLLQSWSIQKAIKKEKELTEQLVESYDLCGIISDNRFGVRSSRIPSAYITHQLKVLSGMTTWLSTKLHQRYIKKFETCWVPDFEKEPNLSGELGHLKNDSLHPIYLGPVSRFSPNTYDPAFDILLLLSGPEPQRGILENRFIRVFENDQRKVLMVAGKVENSQIVSKRKNMTVVNFMTTDELEKAINQSKIVVARSGYTTVMDLSKLKKRVFLIPTPGQFEQEYLARHLDSRQLAPFCKQSDFNLGQIDRLSHYKGLSFDDFEPDYKTLFSLFEGK